MKKPRLENTHSKTVTSVAPANLLLENSLQPKIIKSTNTMVNLVSTIEEKHLLQLKREISATSTKSASSSTSDTPKTVKKLKNQHHGEHHKQQLKPVTIDYAVVSIKAEIEEMPTYSFSSVKCREVSITELGTTGNLNKKELYEFFGRKSQVNKEKISLMRVVSSSLISGPNMKNPHDEVRSTILLSSKAVAQHSPEFILKVALYTRNELNIRTTANLLLAFASREEGCRHYLSKYYNTCVRLPSDWIEIADQYQLMDDKKLKKGSLPSALRRAMITKFADFDVYQLGKYNKQSKKNKKKKQLSDSKFPKLETKDGSSSESESRFDEDDDEKDSKKGKYSEVASLGSSNKFKPKFDEGKTPRTFTMKQLVRMLHINRPAEHIMGIVGKKYPEDVEGFRKAGLLGVFEESRSGKRMKLPTPETWETQVSLKGNKARTWEELLDKRKLPYMAMLRNMRNMIIAGISKEHHQRVLRTLSNEKAVANSRQFPLRFLSAYYVLDDLEVKLKELDSGNQGMGKGRQRGGKVVKMSNKFGKKKQLDKNNYVVHLIDQYRKTLNDAVEIATRLNVPPIPGTTVVLCDVSSLRVEICKTAKGLGKPLTVEEIGLLLGLMCQSACENCELRLVGDQHHKRASISACRGKTPLLERLKMLKTEGDVMKIYTQTKDEVFNEIFSPYLKDKVKIDNLVVLCSGRGYTEIADFLPKYRRIVNPNLLYVSVDLLQNKLNATTLKDVPSYIPNPNDVCLAGFSDQLLRFVAERGGLHQLHHVETIDAKYKLKEVSPPRTSKPQDSSTAVFSSKSLLQRQPRWRTIRVFISSTFRDFHGERDLLVRFIFPEIRSRARSIFFDVHEVDLRWGITEEEAETNKAMEVCLQESSRCDIFVGLLGDRYGHVLLPSEVPKSEDFDWVRSYTPHSSITELEFHAGALSRGPNASFNKDRALFFIRDNAFISAVPEKLKDDFQAESEESKKRLNKLKQRVLSSGFPVYNNYPCEFGGMVGERRPIVSGLQTFGERVMENMWNGLVTMRSDEDKEDLDRLSDSSEDNLSQSMTASFHLGTFLGRTKLIEECVTRVKEHASSLMVLKGKSGCGKTALMARLLNTLQTTLLLSTPVVGYFINSSSSTSTAASMIRYISQQIRLQCKQEQSSPDDDDNSENNNLNRLTLEFVQLVKRVTSAMGRRLVLLIDGLEEMETSDVLLSWLPDPLIDGLTIIVSVTEGSTLSRIMSSKRTANFIQIPPLTPTERGLVVKQTLAPHRKHLSETLGNNQLHLVTSKTEAGKPLYLLMACREVRLFASFELVSEHLRKLPPTLDGLLKMSVKRLCEEYGRDLVLVALNFLIISKDGLLEEELWHLMSFYFLLRRQLESSSKSLAVRKNQLYGQFGHSSSTPLCELEQIRRIYPRPEELLPRFVLAQLVYDLDGLVLSVTDARQQKILKVGHSEISKSISGLQNEKETAKLRRDLQILLAGYRYNEADPDRNHQWNGNSTRAFRLLIPDLVNANLAVHAAVILTDLRFLYVKTKLGLCDDLVRDYNLTIEQYPAAPTFASSSSTRLKLQSTLDSEGEPRLQFTVEGRQRLEEYRHFVSCNRHLFRHQPSIIFQQAINEPSSTGPGTDAPSLLGTDDFLKTFMWLNKPKKIKPCLETLAQSEPITSVNLLESEQALVYGTRSGSVHVYRMDSGKEEHVLFGHSDVVTSVTFVGSCRLCSASKDGSLVLWNWETGNRIANMTGHQKQVSAVCCDPAMTLIVSVSWDATMRTWISRSGQESTVMLEKTPINCVDFHPTRQMVAVGLWDSTLRLWDLQTVKRKAIMRGHTSSLKTLKFSPNGNYVASASITGEVKLWSTTGGFSVVTINAHKLPVNQLTFINEGAGLATASDDQSAKVWESVFGIEKNLKPNTDGTKMIAMTAVDNGRSLLTADNHSNICKVHLQSGATAFTVNHSPAYITGLCATKIYICVAYSDKVIRVLEAETGKLATHLTGFETDMTAVTGLTHGVISGTDDGTLVIHTLPYPVPKATRELTAADSVRAHCGKVTSGETSFTKRWCVTTGIDKCIKVWAITNKKKFQLVASRESCHSDWINASTWYLQHSENFIVTGSNDCSLKLWKLNEDSQTIDEVRTLGTAPNVITYVMQVSAVSVVCACPDGTVEMYTLEGQRITSVKGQHSTCFAGFTSDDEKPDDWYEIVRAEELSDEENECREINVGRQPLVWPKVTVVRGYEEGIINTVLLCQAKPGTTLSGHSDPVLGIKEFEETSKVVTCSSDCTIRVWNTGCSSSDSAEVNNLLESVHDAPVSAMDWCSAHSALLSSDENGVVALRNKSYRSSYPQYVCSVQAHSKRVTGIRFTFDDPQIVGFCTVSTDGYLSFWETDCTTSVQKMERVCPGNPNPTVVSAVPLCCLDYSKEKELVAVGGWNSLLTLFHVRSRQIVAHVASSSSPHWVMKMAFTGSSKLVVANTNGSLHIPQLTVHQLPTTTLSDAKGFKQVQEDIFSFPTNEGFDLIHPTSLTYAPEGDKRNSSLLLGLSNGKLIHHRSNTHTKPSHIKVHSSDVTAVEYLQEHDLVITASTDCRLKLWNIGGGQSITQVAQYICQAPVRSVIVLEEKPKVLLACGDSHGHIDFLEWVDRSRKN